MRAASGPTTVQRKQPDLLGRAVRDRDGGPEVSGNAGRVEPLLGLRVDPLNQSGVKLLAGADGAGKIPRMDGQVGGDLRDVVRGRCVAIRQVHKRFERAWLGDGCVGFLHRVGPRGHRVSPEQIAVESITHLGDRLSGQQRRHPPQLVDEVVDQGPDVPLGTRSRSRPLIVTDRPNPAAELGHGRCESRFNRPAIGHGRDPLPVEPLGYWQIVLVRAADGTSPRLPKPSDRREIMGPVRTEPSILHMDLDAFYAAVEQRDKPSLRGKPVVVGGLGPRGVVATASYEARVFGVHSAMPMSQARARCPNAAYLYPRFGVYQRVSAQVMEVLRRYSPIIEPLSLDEAFADLTAGEHADLSEPGVRRIAGELKAEITAATRLTASVGAATSKFIAKLASDLDKPDGLRVVPPGEERELLRPLPVTKLWGVGPATAIRLHTAGIDTIEELERLTLEELTGLLGQAWGGQLYRLARADDERSVLAERETKSISVEETFDRDILDLGRLAGYST